MAVWVEATSYEWYCDECLESDGGYESERAAQVDGDRHNVVFHQEEARF